MKLEKIVKSLVCKEMEEKITSERIDFLDTLKGIAMYLVILGHVYIPNYLNTIIYSFHMPLFFIISGATIKIDKILETDFKIYLKRQIRNYIIPYFWIELFLLPLWYLRMTVSNSDFSFLDAMKGIIISNAQICNFPASTTWFVLTLFISHIIFAFLLKISYGDKRILLCLSIFCAIFSWTQRNIDYPWHYTVSFAGVFFLFIGNQLFSCLRNNMFFQEIKNSKKILVSCFLFLFGLVCIYSNHGLSMNLNHFGAKESLLLYYFMSVSMSIGLAIIVLVLPCSKMKLLNYIGKNTFFYMAIQGEILPILLLIFPVLEKNYFLSVLESILVFIILAGICFLVNSFFPWINAKRTLVITSPTKWSLKKYFGILISFYIPFFMSLKIIFQISNYCIALIIDLIFSLVFLFLTRKCGFIYLEDF